MKTFIKSLVTGCLLTLTALSAAAQTDPRTSALAAWYFGDGIAGETNPITSSGTISYSVVPTGLPAVLRRSANTGTAASMQFCLHFGLEAMPTACIPDHHLRGFTLYLANSGSRSFKARAIMVKHYLSMGPRTMQLEALGSWTPVVHRPSALLTLKAAPTRSTPLPSPHTPFAPPLATRSCLLSSAASPLTPTRV